MILVIYLLYCTKIYIVKQDTIQYLQSTNSCKYPWIISSNSNSFRHKIPWSQPDAEHQPGADDPGGGRGRRPLAADLRGGRPQRHPSVAGNDL